MELHRKRALVTGAAVRVGREIALALAAKGADILLHYRSSHAEAEDTAAAVRAVGVRCETLQADLSVSADVTRLAREALGTGPVHILVNSASLFYKTPPDTVTESDWDTLLDANLKGPFLLSLALGKAMAADRGGTIVNIADWSGFRPYRDFMPYCVSKGGLLTLTKALARDFAPNVRVNAVAPGPVLPPPDLSEEERLRVIRKTLLGRWGTPRDIAAAVIFLAESDFINGTVLVVDGGRSIV
jgi:NAD(P)-dependent dehydrogenase (short-subunit alcohol dehydrogenase family)